MNAGYRVVAIDAFSDAQTVTLAEKSLVVKYNHLGFDADDLMQTVYALDDGSFSSDGLQLGDFVGFVYGSGLEAQPSLLQKLVTLIPLIGNSWATLAATKDLNVFFSVMQKLNIKHPETFKQLPSDVDIKCYLRKFSGGSGGMHIQYAASIQGSAPDRCYFQRKLLGVPVSLLFIANGTDVQAVGFNEQWVSPSHQLPYRYGGAVSHALLSVTVQQQLLEAARQLTREFGLLGLNSLDAIVHSTSTDVCAEVEHVSMLEINPRLSATLDLYDNSGVLFDRHVQACMYNRLADVHELQDVVVVSKAHAVVYADIDMTLKTEMVWPDWVTDTPSMVSLPLKIVAGAPVCSVIAFANNADAAKKEVLTRVQQIKNLLKLTH